MNSCRCLTSHCVANCPRYNGAEKSGLRPGYTLPSAATQMIYTTRQDHIPMLRLAKHDLLTKKMKTYSKPKKKKSSQHLS